MSPTIAVLIPCYNEAATIADVVADFAAALPGAAIHVYDNNSSDATVDNARYAGAQVRKETRQGKGNVMRRMFADIEADFYVMVDGDATYDAASAPAMLKAMIEDQLDMVVARRSSTEEGAYRAGHQFGNRLLSNTVGWIFGNQVVDILSGFRILSRRLVKSFPAVSGGFEIETELTIHALKLRVPVIEIETPYRARPEGSESKLNTFSDGVRILGTIIRLFVLEKPFQFFLLLALLFFTAASVLFIPVLAEYFATGQVAKFPSLIVAVGGFIMSLISLVMGTLLYTTTTGRVEARRFQYLGIPPFSP